MMQRQGQTGPDGAPAPSTAAPAAAAPGRRRQAAHHARCSSSARCAVELARSPGPPGPRSSTTRRSCSSRSILLIGLIFVLDYAFSKSVLFLFKA